MTWWQVILVMLAGWFVVELVRVFVVGFARGWRATAERMALEDSTVTGDTVDQQLWAMTDDQRRRTGR